MTIQTYPKNFANLNVPEPPRGAVLVNLADVEAWLKDSTAMHSNILRGDIALTREQAIHIAGLPADIEAQLVAANRKIVEQEQLLNRCREDINRMQQKYEPFAVLKDGIWPDDESLNAPARREKVVSLLRYASLLIGVIYAVGVVSGWYVSHPQDSHWYNPDLYIHGAIPLLFFGAISEGIARRKEKTSTGRDR